MTDSNNIFESSMASFEFMMAVTDRIAKDWKESGADDEEKLCEWLRGGFIDTLEKDIRRAVKR